MTTVLVCADEPNPALNLEVDGAEVVQVEGLCASPKRTIPNITEEETELVFMVHRRQVNLGAIQSAVRQLGFDPLGIGIVDMGELTGPEQTVVACGASIARVARYPGSVPEQVKLAPAERNTRRDLLSLGAPVYVGAPLIVGELCVAGDGCRACVTGCPVDALTRTGGSIGYDINTCVACGICVTTCPTGAIRNPAVDPEAVEAEIVSVVGASDEGIGIRYRCRGSVVSGEPGWHLVEVPCTGMLTLGWLLAPLLHGAADVDAVDCQTGGCRLGNSRRLHATRSDFEVFLAALPEDSAPGAGQTPRTETGWLSTSTGRVIAEMTRTETSVSVTLETADVGLVRIDPTTCTACEMCCRICPTEALLSVVDESGVHISFDPRVCVACAQCVATCPEDGAIAITHGFDSNEWAVGRKELRHEGAPMCEICGKPVAPAAMLNRIEEMLGAGFSTTMEMISRRCVGCRGR